jgi:serine/threonine-protein kinase
VHPGNVLVDAGGGVRLIDLGRAAIEGGGRRAAPGRAGVPFYFEPEYARAVLARRPAPTATRASEQYAVAALLYALATGGRHLDFSLEEQVSLRQIAREAPLPFAHHGRAPWPELEAVLGRALARSPGQRYPSMDRLADALAALSPKRAARARSGSEALPRLLDAFLVRVSPGGERYAEGVVEAPRSSVSLGAAGIGYALYRIALRREDPRLLPLADVWLSRARRGAAGDDGFVAPAIDLVAAKVGRHSVHHAGPGLAWAEALVALAMGSRAAAGAAARAFAEAAVAPGGEIDVSFGRAGLLLGAASLADAGCAEEVRAAGDALTAGIWETLDALAPVGGAPEMPSLGVAHGWAGVLFATLRWCAASGAAVPGGTAARVDELFALAEPWGRGVRFRRVLSPDPLSPRDYVSGWCNGTAGMVHLALAAHEVLGDPRFLDVAERCALGAWEHAEARADLCCGFGGRAYALLALHAAIGGRAWLERARGLSARAAAAIGEQSIRRESLYRGEAGIAVLAAEIDRPELAAMPLFAGEGWRGAPAAGGRGG